VSAPPFATVLVANRGEIARRIFHACAALGIRTVAVASEPDRHAAWHRDADHVVPLEGATATESYLDQAQILTAARRTGAEAIHPGYGFLSENAAFAEACANAGIVFIGPPIEAMRRMGAKTAAIELAMEAGVPTVPGARQDERGDAGLREAAKRIGYPLLVKASAGGGGRGMRLVREAAELDDALQAARAEAKSAFGDDTLLLERFFERARHIEVQVLGDQHGGLVHLFERECSIQRRYQKIIEEAPSPAVDEALRARMTGAALDLARAAGYHNAGTIEFLLDDQENFYFLEMNTRLQVEHPVTEEVTGIDLVACQIRVAAGEPLGFTQADVSLRGHAIECRLYAEDPATGFLPSTGRLALYRRPHGPGLRCDDGVATGSIVSPHYDPMLAKIIAMAGDRDAARRRMIRALRDTVALGVRTNLSYLLTVLEHPDFATGQTYTAFLGEHPELATAEAEVDEDVWLAAAALEALGAAAGDPATGAVVVAAADGGPSGDPWGRLGRWRNGA
jgi:acetyl-CoA carboxylase biotin carboxylase subunit